MYLCWIFAPNDFGRICKLNLYQRWGYSTVERFEKIWTKIKEKNKDMTIFWYGEDHQALAFSLRRPSCLWRSGCAYVEYVADMKLADTLWTSTDSLPTSIYSRRTSTDSLLTSTDSLLTCTDSLLNLYWLLLTLYWLLLTLYWLLLTLYWRLPTIYLAVLISNLYISLLCQKHQDWSSNGNNWFHATEHKH